VLMPPKPKGKGRAKTPMGFPPMSTEECDRAHRALNPGVNKSLPDSGNSPPSPSPEELMPLVGAMVPQKRPLPLKTPLNPSWDWCDHCGKPGPKLADALPPADAPHPPSLSTPFQWHKFFKDMEFASCNISNPAQSMAFCRILFNYLYRSIRGSHSDDFKKMQLDNTTIQTMISELSSHCAPINKPLTAPLPLVSVQSLPHKKVKHSQPNPSPPKAVTLHPPSNKPKDEPSRPPTTVTSQSSGASPSRSAHRRLCCHQASHTT
jgi:hypothetical protein